jgi:hypothetical protein
MSRSTMEALLLGLEMVTLPPLSWRADTVLPPDSEVYIWTSFRMKGLVQVAWGWGGDGTEGRCSAGTAPSVPVNE